MKKKLKVLALFDAIRPTTIDQDLSKEMKTEDWKTEANVLNALGTLGYTAEHLAIFDDLDLLRQKLENNPRHPEYILTVHGLGYKFAG